MGLSKGILGEVLDNSIEALKEYDYNALIGLESATEYWGLSTFYTVKPTILFNDDNIDNNGIDVELSLVTVFVPNVNTENIVHLSEHLRITDPEQTVIDMIRYNRHEFHLYETLISAIDDKQVNIDRLNKLAKQYNVYEKMYKLLEQALLAEQEDSEQ